MSNDFINVSAKTSCSSKSSYIEALAAGKRDFLTGADGIPADIGLALSAVGADVSVYARDYTVARKETKNARETVGQVSETATLPSSKLKIEISAQQLDNVDVIGYDTVILSECSIQGLYAAEILTVSDDKVGNNGYTGTYSQTYRYNDDAGRLTNVYSRKSDVVGAVTIKDNVEIESIAGYKSVSATGGNWSVSQAMGEKETYQGEEGNINGPYVTTEKLSVTSASTLALEHFGTLCDASGYLNVSIHGDGADSKSIVVTGNVQSGTYTESSSYSYNSSSQLEKLTTACVFTSTGTVDISNASGSEGALRGFTTVNLTEGATDMYVYGGTAKDAKNCQTLSGSVEEMPLSLTLERYAAGTATVKTGASVVTLNGYDKVTVSGTVASIDRDDILQENYREYVMTDFVSYMASLGQGFEEDAWAYTGKITKANTYSADTEECTYSKTDYSAKKGGTLQVNADGSVEYANGYGTVTVTGGQITGKVSQTMLSKWTYVETHSEGDSRTAEEDDDKAYFSSVTSKAEGKLTVQGGTLGDIYGYSTIKVDGDVDKKTKAVLAMARITGSIYADNYTYGYTEKTESETITTAAAGTVTLSNTYLQGDIEGIATVTLTGVTWDGDASRGGSIYGGKRTSSYNSSKGDCDEFDVLGTVKLTSSDMGAIYGVKSVTLVDSSVTCISVDNEHIAKRWSREDVSMTKSSKLAGTVTVTDSSVQGVIDGYSTLTVKNTAASTKVPEAGRTEIAEYYGTAGDDKVTFTNGKVEVVGGDLEASRAVEPEVAAAVMDFGEGKNTFAISNNTEVEIAGGVLFGASDDKLSIGKCATLTASNVQFGNGKNTLDIGQDATVAAELVSFGTGDDKLTLNGGALLEVDSLTFEGGKNTVDLKKSSRLVLNGGVSLGGNSASKMTVAGEVFLTTAEAAKSLRELENVKVDKTGVFTTTQEIYDGLSAKTIGGKAIAVVGTAEQAAAYAGILEETSDNTFKTAVSLDDFASAGEDGWLSQDDGTGLYLTDDIDYYKLGEGKYYFTGDVVTTYYDAKGKAVTDMAAASYVSVGILAQTSGEKQTGVVTYGVKTMA